VQHRGAVAALGFEGEIQRVSDILGSHVGTQLPGDDVAREVVEDGRHVGVRFCGALASLNGDCRLVGRTPRRHDLVCATGTFRDAFE
jgi:hypothetical protein